MELSQVQARDLDKFIEDHLLPDTPFRRQVRRAIHDICSFLKEECFQGAPHPVRVSKVVKGGSSGKGTTLRGRSDADLVVFLSQLRSFQEQLDRRGEFIREIRRQLVAYQRETEVQFDIQDSSWQNPRALTFTFSSPWLEESVEFDVLPAFDVLGQLTRSPGLQISTGYRPDPQIYVRLIKECTRLGKEGEFSPCFTELQRAFLKQRPTKLKSLIRLVKYWYQLCKESLGKPLPPQYALELLTVYAWECGSQATDFSTAQGFRTVLELVMNYQELHIFWTEYYDFENPVISQYLLKQLKKPRPVILDPADPTGNVAGGQACGWLRLAQEAEDWLSYPCFQNWDGSPVSPWNIQLHHGPISCGCRIYEYEQQREYYQTYEAPQKEENWTCTIL
ncbi:PREDICTED: 2'-5'-oligoadenylate synthase 1-like [Miniopterus natalensis]|uniref:2'-5'-oligoadenylate synthase 1-like n=1 Tax=Miniopterus natalensis TaxID=291302 RepID=UPI0007A71B4A|nr:PREDICTED: 2'-5'-oligoadenylate synthase 1-like [Miniopterus natalensis]